MAVICLEYFLNTPSISNDFLYRNYNEYNLELIKFFSVLLILAEFPKSLRILLSKPITEISFKKLTHSSLPNQLNQ